MLINKSPFIVSRFNPLCWFLCSLCWLLLILPATGYADEKTIYRIGVENIDYYPHYAFGFQKPSFAQELIERFFDDHSADVIFISLPLKRFNQWYGKDDIDFKYPDNRDWRQDEQIKRPVIYSTEVVRLTAGTTVPFNKLGIKRDNIKRLGTILGFYPTLYKDRVDAGYTTIINDPSVLSVIRMSMNGIVDGTNLDYSVINHHLKSLGKAKALLMDKSLPHMTFGFHLSTLKHPDMIARFNQFYADNQALIKRLKAKYHIIDDPFDLSSF